MRVLYPYRPLVAVAMLVAGSSTAWATVPRQFNFQGCLTGVNEPTPNLTITFWDAAAGGNQLFHETHTGVPLSGGVFSLRIGSVNNGIPDSAIAAPQVWLGVSVNGGPELPRTRLVAVPWAFEARAAGKLVDPGTGAGVVVPGADGGAEFREVNGSLLGDIVGHPNFLCNGTKEELYHRHAPGGPAYLSILLDTNDDDSPCDSQIVLYDDSEHMGMRLHSDRTNGGAELSMFAEDTGDQERETVEILANSEGGTEWTGGKITLRMMPEGGGTPVDCLELTAQTSVNPSPIIAVKSTYTGDELFTVQTWHVSGVATGDARVYDSSGNEAGMMPGAVWCSAAGSISFAGLLATADGGEIRMNSATTQRTIWLVAADGSITADGAITACEFVSTGCDLAERFPVSETLLPGLVVAIDPDHPGQLCLARGEYNRCVAGVVSGANGLHAGAVLGHVPDDGDAPPIALSGRAWVQCDGSSGAIRPGDLLTSSSVAGHAMRVSDYARANGTVIGKAMTGLAEGERGLVLVLVNLQ